MLVVDIGALDGRRFAIPYAQDVNNIVYALESAPAFAEHLRSHHLPNLHVFCVEVESETFQLDLFFEENSLAEVDLLKINAPKALEILKRARNAIHRVKRIIIQSCENTSLFQSVPDQESITTHLSSNGFRLLQPTSQTTESAGDLEFIRINRYPLPNHQSGSFEVHLPYVGKIQTPKADHVGQLLEEGAFEGLEQAFLWLYLRPGDTFFDCGAHVGLFSCIAAKRLNNNGEIVGVEPNPLCFDLYKKNLEALGCTCFKALDVGLSDTNGTAELLLGKPGMSAFSTFAQNASAITQIDGEAVIGRDTVLVSQRSLDSILQELNIDTVTLAKLDVEGWEIPVLKGAEQSIRAGRLPLWMIEFTEANAAAAGTSTRELRNLLEDLGYTLCRFDATNFCLVPEPVRLAYPYANLFAVLDMNAVNQRLAAADPDLLAIAQDIVQRWETAAMGVEMRRNFYQEKQRSQDLQQQVQGYATTVDKLNTELRRWVDSNEAKLADERRNVERLQQYSQQLEQHLQASHQQLQELRQHLLASRWLKLGRQLGLTKLDDVFKRILRDTADSTNLSVTFGVGSVSPDLSTHASPPSPSPLSMEFVLHHLFQKGFKPEIVLDLGAAKGYWSEYAQSFFPEATFYMVDPLQESEVRLQELCESSDRFHYILCAVGDRTDQLLMNVTTDLDGSSLLSFNRPPEPQDRVVELRRVDDLLAEGKLKPPQLVKMDLQGYELKALEGGQRLFETADVFIMETSLFEFMPEQPLVHEVVAYMAARNYVVFDIAGHIRRPYEDDLGQVDFVFVKRDSPLRASNRWS